MVPMNRRGFLKTLISAAGAVAAAPYVPAIIREPVYKWGVELQSLEAASQSFVEALAASMLETKEAMTANILNRAFGDPD